MLIIGGIAGPLTVTTDLLVKVEEEVIDILLPVASIELSDDARAALKVLVLQELMYQMCSIHILDFFDLVEEHGVNYEESLVEAVDGV